MARCIDNYCKAHINIQPAPIFVKSASDHHAISCSCSAFCNSLAVSLPVPLAQFFRDDDVQTFPQHFFSRESKHRFSTLIPDTNEPLTIGKDDGISCLLDNPPVDISLNLFNH